MELHYWFNREPQEDNIQYMMLSDREGFRKLSHWSVSKMNVKELNHVSVRCFSFLAKCSCVRGDKRNRKCKCLAHSPSNLLSLPSLSPDLPCRLHSVQSFQFCCGNFLLPAQPLVIRGPAVTPNRAWCFVTFSISPQKLCISVDIQPYA